ncbi:MAG: DUF2062 domain-containing protein [Desulfovibrio sp.]|jgi:uncharacterized protein (DUF2062 family)|nr:DUF2062 domain-containing protein [Desulfovibrio sp.]
MFDSPHPQDGGTPPSDADSAGDGAPGPRRHGRSVPDRLWRAVRLHRLRLVRLPSTPHRIALGVGLGMLIGSIPLIPSQMLLAGVVAWLLRASPTAAVIATLYSNPVTFGPLYAIFFAIGSFLLPNMHVALPDDVANLTSLLSMGWDVYLVLCAGGVVFGAVAGVVGYVATHRMVAAYQQRRVRWRTGARNAPPVLTGCAPSDAGDGCEPDGTANGGRVPGGRNDRHGG